MTKVLTPTQLANLAIDQLKSCADPQVAQQMRRYFKEHDEIDLIGVKTPGIREIEKQLLAKIKQVWSFAEACECCEILISNSLQEPKILGISLLSRFHKTFESSLLQSIHSWLTHGYCRNWAAVDALAMTLVTPIIDKFPSIVPALTQWAHSENMWIRRTAAVAFVKIARKGEHLAELLLDNKEDLMHKAVGWLLRDAGKTDAVRLESFLLGHGPQIPRTTLRYAIEKFPEPRRQEILKKTKRAN